MGLNNGLGSRQSLREVKWGFPKRGIVQELDEIQMSLKVWNRYLVLFVGQTI